MGQANRGEFMKEIKDDNEFFEIHKNARGYIYNDYAGSEGYPKFNVLHESSCPTCNPRYSKGMGAHISKIYFENLEEARSWLNKNRKNHYKSCGKCMG